MRAFKKLSALAVQKTSKPGLYGDGGGLYLVVGDAGNKNWAFRFMLNGRARQMGLGPVHTISLADARERAARARLLHHDGVDPIEAKRASRDAARTQAEQGAESAKAATFRQAAEAYIEAHEPSWKNAKHAAQWTSTLTTYAYPAFGKLAVASVTTDEVMQVVQPLWTTKNETAGRVRGRIERVLDYAEARGWRAGDNPARWSGHLSKLLPKRSKVAKVEHHAALSWREIGAFVSQLRGQPGVAALALEFAILTAARTGEVIGARWSEIDATHTVWTVPAGRMKAGREHRVPLSDAALAVLHKLRPSEADPGAFVFPGGNAGKGLSNTSPRNP